MEENRYDLDLEELYENKNRRACLSSEDSREIVRIAYEMYKKNHPPVKIEPID